LRRVVVKARSDLDGKDRIPGDMAVFDVAIAIGVGKAQIAHRGQVGAPVADRDGRRRARPRRRYRHRRRPAARSGGGQTGAWEFLTLAQGPEGRRGPEASAPGAMAGVVEIIFRLVQARSDPRVRRCPGRHRHPASTAETRQSRRPAIDRSHGGAKPKPSPLSRAAQNVAFGGGVDHRAAGVGSKVRSTHSPPSRRRCLCHRRHPVAQMGQSVSGGRRAGCRSARPLAG
jgi:hypothetical protein